MPVLALSDGRLLKVEGTVFRTSSDDGKTWSPARKIYDGPKPGIPSSDEASSQLLRTRSGALVLVYMDMSTEKWKWDGAKNEAAPDSRLDVWAIRSLDEGNTWIDRQKILDGYCGALIGTIQTTSGQLVTPMQTMLDGRRHVTVTRVSADDGKTWQGGNIIDLGGRGDHDGVIEATVTQLATGRLLMLIRTNLDRFWEAYSDDEGRYWRELRPSQLDASSSPGHLIRLASGRLAWLGTACAPRANPSFAAPGRTGRDGGQLAARGAVAGLLDGRCQELEQAGGDRPVRGKPGLSAYLRAEARRTVDRHASDGDLFTAERSGFCAEIGPLRVYLGGEALGGLASLFLPRFALLGAVRSAKGCSAND